jgi:ribosomal protein S18 acetylase RimI-like enzyme
MQISSTITNSELYDIVNIGKECLPIYYKLYHLIKLINDTNYIILKCVINENIIGFAIIKKRKKDHIHIMSIAILNIYRGLGHGSNLLNKIKELFPNSKISLYVQIKNNNAVQFYIKNHFKIEKTINNYYEELEHKHAYYCMFTPIRVSI